MKRIERDADEPAVQGSITVGSDHRPADRKAPLLSWQRDLLVALNAGLPPAGPGDAKGLQSLADDGLVEKMAVPSQPDTSVWRISAAGREALQHGWYR